MKSLVVISLMPTQMHQWIDPEAVKTQLRTYAQQYPLLAQAPSRLIIAPYPLPVSIANACLDEATEVMIEEGNVESSVEKVNASTSLRRNDKLVKLKGYCLGLPEGKYALAVLSTFFYNSKVGHSADQIVIKWPLNPIVHVSEMTKVEQTDLSRYALDDLQARLQLRGLAEAKRELHQREEEIKQQQSGFNLDSVRSALRELLGKLPAPTRCTLPRPPQPHPVDISALQQSTEALLASVNLLKSHLHNST